MGGGLVEEKEVRRVEEELAEGEAAFFTAAEDGDGFEDIVAAEEEAAEEIADELFRLTVFDVHGFFEDRPFELEHFGAVLGEVAGADIVSGGAGAGLGREDSGHDFEHGGFACAVRADEDGALAAFDFDFEVFVNDEIAVGEVDGFEGHDALAAAGRLRKAEVNGFGGFEGGLDFLHALDLLELALGLSGFGGFGAEAVGEVLEFFDFLLLIFVGLAVLFGAGFFFAEEGVVVAVVEMEALPCDFDDAADEGVEEFAVVRDHEDRAGVGFEVFLEPEEGFEVEVVGGFVEEEEVGLLDEEAGEVGAHDPAAGEGAGGAVEVGVAEGEAFEDAAGFWFDFPAAVFVGVHGGEFEDGFVASGGGFLGEEAEGDAAFHGDLAVVGALFAEDDGEERGFAGAVGADEADAFAAVNLEGDVAEKHAAGEGFGDIGELQHAEGSQGVLRWGCQGGAVGEWDLGRG